MFPSQMVRLKIVEPSSGPLCICFPRKWYAIKLSNSQVVDFVHVSLANGMPKICRTLKWSTLSNVSLANGTTLKLSNPQVVHFVHVSLTNGTP